MTTFEAVLVTILAILPGAVYVWAFEREAGRWGIGLSDRVLRFAAATAIFQTLYAIPLLALWRRYFHQRVTTVHYTTAASSRVAVHTTHFVNHFTNGDAIPWTLVFVPVVYLGLPILVGTLGANAVRSQSEKWWVRLPARILAGRAPAPRAWDDWFSESPVATVRMRLKSDRSWIGGFFSAESYAAGYPEEPQDLLLEKSYRMHEDGSFVTDDTGGFIEVGSHLLIRWEEVEFAEFFPLKSN